MTRHRRWIGVFIILAAMSGGLFAQDKAQVDERIWSQQYWKQMIEAGLVQPNPDVQVPEAVYTGSRINARTVLQNDIPDIAIINATNTTQSETSVFVNPLDYDKALNSNNSTPFPVAGIYGTSSFMTSDAGMTWPGTVQGTGGDNSGDPAAVIDLNGRYYVGYIADDGGNGTAYSTDEGATWTHVQVAPNPGSLADKNHLWVDNAPNSPHEGNLYAAWTDFGGVNDRNVVVSRSTDGGLTWSTRVNVSNNLPGFHQGVNVQVGPDGTVYAFYTVYVNNTVQDEPAYGVSISTDGGATWGQGQFVIQNTRGIRSTGTSKNHRVNSFPVAAADISGGPRNGWLYMVWANIGVPGVNQGPGIDIYMIRSTDNAVSWSTPVRVNQDPIGQGNENYFPWLTCDPVTGALSVIFYSDRNVSSTQCEAFVANSIDGGSTWEDFKVSDVAFTPAPIPGLASGYMGDYLAISAAGGKVYPVWADNRTGNVLAYTNPYILADPTDPNGPGNFDVYSDFNTPTSMALSWTDPTTYVNGDTLLPANFTIEIERDGVSIASVAAGTESYTDNGLVDGQLYEYTLFTKDTFDSLSIPVSGSWTAGGSPIPNPPTSFFVTEFDSVQLQMNWTNPSANIDGTPMDDFAGINLYENGNLVATFTRTAGDTGAADSAVFNPAAGTNQYYVTAIDNESPANESVPSGISFSPIRLPFFDDFPIAGDPNAGFWINTTANVNDLGVNPPSPQYVLNMDGQPSGGETIELLPVDLSGRQGEGLIVSFWYQPQGTGNAPESGDSLAVEFLNDQGQWRKVRGWPGTAVVPFVNEVISVDGADPGAGATFFHPQFQFRFRNVATASSTSSFDNWLIDDVFVGVPTANPIMAVSPSSVADTTLEGGTGSGFFVVTNDNPTPSTLNYTVVEPAGVGWIALSPLSGTLASREVDTISVDLNSAGLTPGTYQTEVIVTGDDAGNPADTVAVTFVVEPAPVAGILPDSMFFVLDSAQVDSQAMTITNTGGGALSYRLQVADPDTGGTLRPARTLPHSARVDESFLPPELQAAIARRTVTPRPVADVDGAAVPDELSPDPANGIGGPPEVINGEEIFGGTDSPFSGGSRDRGNVFRVDDDRRLVEYKAYLSIPSSVPIYFAVYEGTALLGTYTKVAETFQANSGTGEGFYASGPINYILEAGKYYYICASWGNATVTYYRGGPPTPLATSFGALETGVPATSAGFPPAATISQTRNPGAFVAYYCAITTESPITWVDVASDSGTVAANSSADVQVRVNSTALSPGDYAARVVMESNDPVTPVVSMPVLLTVNPDTNAVNRTIAVDPASLAFSTDLFVGESESLPLSVVNTGTANLTVSGISSDNGDVTAAPSNFSVPSGDTVEVTVTYAPTGPGALSATLTIASNAGNDPALAVPVSGGAVLAPVVSVTPDSLTYELLPGDSADQTLTIGNTVASGGADLQWSATVLSDMALALRQSGSDRRTDGYPRGSAPVSVMPAPRSAGEQRGGDSGSDPILAAVNARAYGADVFGQQWLRMNPADPANAQQLGLMADAWFAGDFDDAGTFAAIDNNTSNLAVIDTASGGVTILGTIAVQSGHTWTGLTYDVTTATWYAASTNGTTAALYTVDPSGPTSTLVGTSTAVPLLIDIAIDGNGDMYGHDIAADAIFAIDKSSFTATQIGATGFDANFAQGMAFDRSTGDLYLAAYNGASSQAELRLVDRGTGSATLIGPIGTGTGVEVGAFGFAVQAEQPVIALVGATSGSVAPGATMDLTVRAYGLGGPDTTYSRMVEVSSNDPATPSVRVPVTVTVRDSMTSIAFDGPLPTTFAVSQNYPNPFNPTTTIAYQVPGQSAVRLAVYNVLGQRVRLLVDAVAQPGRYRVTWDGRNDAGARVGSGVYIYRFEAGDYHKVQKMILMK